MSPSTAALLPIHRVDVLGGHLDALAEHIAASNAESGREGAPHFALTRTTVADELRGHLAARLARGLDEPLWGRVWALFAPAGERVVGNVELRGGRVAAEMHRATLGMGIQRAYTGQGHGRRLIEAAVTWARDVAKLSWIDLGVFAGNEPARKLYRRMGFVEIGEREDAFRIDAGVAVKDVMMTLKL
ncbi:MAG: GNAT family N-acetyltransferase [Minicystis sp.]